MTQKKDRLDKLFEMQAQLNNKTFAKQRITSCESHLPLTMESLIALGSRDSNGGWIGDKDIGPNTDTNEWLKKYSWAMGDELRELNDELLQKWWSKDKLDMQNIRVEIIDQLHFWLSLAMTAGMGAKEVFDIYEQKNKVNLDRQNSGYSKATKDESDNVQIK